MMDISIFIAFLLIYSINAHNSFNINSNSSSLIPFSRQLQTSRKRPSVTIIVYDKIRGYLNWMQDWFRQAALKKCSTRCYLSENKDDLSYADIVLFHAPTHGTVPPRYKNNLLYVLLSMEQPLYATILSNHQYLNKNFDLMVTYSSKDYYPNTDIPNLPITYYPLNILTPHAVSHTFSLNFSYN